MLMKMCRGYRLICLVVLEILFLVSYSKPWDVCVVGGGNAGAYLALRAVDNGRSVAILEPSTRLGGHCDSYEVPSGDGRSSAINTGVRILSGDSTNLIRRVHDRFGVRLLDISEGGLGSPVKQKLFDFQNRIDLSFLPGPGETVLRHAVKNYVDLFQSRYAYLEENAEHPDFTSMSSYEVNELLSPFSEFVNRHNLHVLSPYFDAVLSHGYGNRESVPTYFALRTLPPRLLPVLIPSVSLTEIRQNDSFYFAVEGCGALFQRVEVFLRKSGVLIELGATVKQIVRSTARHASVSYSLERNRSLSVRCRSTVIAFPQHIDTLRAMVNLTASEEDVFRRMDLYNSYFTSVWRANGLLVDSSSGFPLAVHNVDVQRLPYMTPRLPATLDFRLEAFDRRFNDSYVNPLRSYEGPCGESHGSVKNKLLQELRALEKKFAQWTGVAVKFANEPEFFEEHLYSLRPSSLDDIRNGIYNRMYELQSNAGTFYVGALFANENQMLIWKYCDQLLEKVLLPFLEGARRTDHRRTSNEQCRLPNYQV